MRANDQRVPFAPDDKQQMPLILHIATQGSYVWFSAGSDAARDELVKTMASQNRSQSRIAGTPLQLRFSLADWLGAKEGADVDRRVPQMALRKMEQAIGRMMPQSMVISVNGKSSTPSKEPLPSYLSKAVTPENSSADLKIDTNGRTLEADLKLGTGIVKIAIAQYLAAQDQMMKGLNLGGAFSFGSDGSSTIKVGSGSGGKPPTPEEVEKMLKESGLNFKKGDSSGRMIIRGGSGAGKLTPEQLKKIQEQIEAGGGQNGAAFIIRSSAGGTPAKDPGK